MMKLVNSSGSAVHGKPEQYNDCSGLLLESDTPPLEQLDPAILSCGLPAIILGDIDDDDNVQPLLATIRYTVSQLLAIRTSPLSQRCPAAINDPQVTQFQFWRRQQVNATDGDLYGMFTGNRRIAMDRQREREHGYMPPRFRRNYDFSNRSQHVIVKSYSADRYYGMGRLQDTVIEEEPEWMSAGPTSRLDTIELRGFDDDLHRGPYEKVTVTAGTSGKRTSFYDDLLHYEHVHQGNNNSNKHDSSSSGAESESVATSNNNSPPPARSTPTKIDQNNNGGIPDRHPRGGSSSFGSTARGRPADGHINTSNFEEFMKFDSLLGDSGDPNGSRFSKWFRRGPPPPPPSALVSSETRRHDSGLHVRFNLDNLNATNGHRGANAVQFAGPPVKSGGFVSDECTDMSNNAGSKSIQRLIEKIAQNQVTNSNGMFAVQQKQQQQQQQQQYLLQLLHKNQQAENLRQMLMKNCPQDNPGGGSSGSNETPPSTGGGPGPLLQQQHHQHRMPTQRELQVHTQTIMKNALLRKKIVEQSRMLFEQQQQPGPASEPIPAVQQLIQSICPNAQRSLAVLAGNHQFNGNAGQCQFKGNQPFGMGGVSGNGAFGGRPGTTFPSAPANSVPASGQSSRPY